MCCTNETRIRHPVYELHKIIVKTENVEQPYRHFVIADLRPAQCFEQFVHRAHAAGQGNEAVGKVGKVLLALVHRLDRDQLRAIVVGEFTLYHRMRDHPYHLTPLIECALRQRAHQAKPPAAIDDADTALRQPRAHVARQFDVARIGRRGRAAIDGEALHLRSSIIRPAVALALPTTPGIPAPGWVPAPTR